MPLDPTADSRTFSTPDSRLPTPLLPPSSLADPTQCTTHNTGPASCPRKWYPGTDAPWRLATDPPPPGPQPPCHMDVESSIAASLARCSGVYNDPPRASRDGGRLLRSPVGSHLRPSTGPLPAEGGGGAAGRPVLVFGGTISMDYRGAAYNIPVDVYLPPPYPHRPPAVYVRPTASMAIKPNHPHVGSDGQVYMPYLSEWRGATHTLVEMAVCLSSLFGAHPPVYARPAPARPRPRHQHQHQHQHQHRRRNRASTCRGE